MHEGLRRVDRRARRSSARTAKRFRVKYSLCSDEISTTAEIKCETRRVAGRLRPLSLGLNFVCSLDGTRAFSACAMEIQCVKASRHETLQPYPDVGYLIRSARCGLSAAAPWLRCRDLGSHPAPPRPIQRCICECRSVAARACPEEAYPEDPASETRPGCMCVISATNRFFFELATMQNRIFC